MQNIKLCLMKKFNQDNFKKPCIGEHCKFWDKYFKDCAFNSGGFVR